MYGFDEYTLISTQMIRFGTNLNQATAVTEVTRSFLVTTILNTGGEKIQLAE